MTEPAGLGVRGFALWTSLTSGQMWDAAGLVLVAEMCRAADRLEKLDGILREDVAAWAQIVDNYDTGHREVVLEIDDALAEARQQQGTLLQIVKMLGLGKATSSPSGPQEDPLDELVRQWASGGATPPSS